MTREQLEAAERYRHANDDCGGNLCGNYCCSWPGRLREDQAELADAYVAEYPADDGEPVTPAWCAENGAVQTYGGPYSHRWYWNFKTAAADGTHVLVSFGDGEKDTRTHLGICGSRVMYAPTRGDVRRLLAALKFPAPTPRSG